MAKKPPYTVVETRSHDGKRTKTPRPEGHRGYWWTASEKTLASAVWTACDAVIRQQETRRNANHLHSVLYGDTAYQHAWRQTPKGRYFLSAPLEGDKDRVTYNLVASAVDTLGAKVSKQKPKAAFVTDGGNWAEQRKAKRLDKFCVGSLYRANTHVEAKKAFRDCEVYDIGCLYFFLEDGRVRCERVHPDEILVDRLDGQHGTPRSVYRVMSIAREVLKDLFPDFAQAIQTAGSPKTQDGLSIDDVDSLADRVDVRLAWHLPSGKDAKDGLHVVAINNQVLHQEPWTRDTFPFVFLRFSERMRGFYGKGVAEALAGRQRSINRKIRRLNECLDRMAVPRILLEAGSEVEEETVTNAVGGIIKYVGQAPIFETPPSIPPGLMESISTDIQQGLEMVGISRLDASAQKPGGLDSRVALREFSDIASERFVLVGQMWEEAFVEMARQVIALAKEAAAKKKPLSTWADGRFGLEKIEWADVDLDEEAFTLKALPTSSLPSSPAARKQTVEEWYAAGWIDGLEARRLLDMPDLDASNNVAFAAQEDIEWLVEDTLDGKPYEGPEPHQDLNYGLKRVQSAYLRAKRQGAPQEVLDNLLQWLDAAKEMLDGAQQPSAPPGPGGDTGGQAMPGAPMAGQQAPPPGPAANPIAPPLA